MLADIQRLFTSKYCICFPFYFLSFPSSTSECWLTSTFIHIEILHLFPFLLPFNSFINICDLCMSFVKILLQVSKLLTRPIFQLLLALPILERTLPLSRFSPLIIPPLIGQSMLNQETWLLLGTFHTIKWRDQWPFWMSLLTSSR